jgi:hypothetical protein
MGGEKTLQGFLGSAAPAGSSSSGVAYGTQG